MIESVNALPSLLERTEALEKSRDELAALLRDWRKLGTDRWHQGSLNESTDAALAKIP